MWVPGQMIPDNCLLSHAASVYTRHVYKLFEQEVTRSLNVVRVIGDVVSVLMLCKGLPHAYSRDLQVKLDVVVPF